MARARLGSMSASLFVSQLNIFSSIWNWFNLVVGLLNQSSCRAYLNLQCHERVRSLCKVSALPAIVVIQLTEVTGEGEALNQNRFIFVLRV